MADQRVTRPFLTKYERARILAVRTEQIQQGDKVYGETADPSITPYQKAVEELQQGKTPLIVRRSLPDGKIEEWKVSELVCDPDGL